MIFNCNAQEKKLIFNEIGLVAVNNNVNPQKFDGIALEKKLQFVPEFFITHEFRDFALCGLIGFVINNTDIVFPNFKKEVIASTYSIKLSLNSEVPFFPKYKYFYGFFGGSYKTLNSKGNRIFQGMSSNNDTFILQCHDVGITVGCGLKIKASPQLNTTIQVGNTLYSGVTRSKQFGNTLTITSQSGSIRFCPFLRLLVGFRL